MLPLVSVLSSPIPLSPRALAHLRHPTLPCPPNRSPISRLPVATIVRGVVVPVRDAVARRLGASANSACSSSAGTGEAPSKPANSAQSILLRKAPHASQAPPGIGSPALPFTTEPDHAPAREHPPPPANSSKSVLLRRTRSLEPQQTAPTGEQPPPMVKAPGKAAMSHVVVDTPLSRLLAASPGLHGCILPFFFSADGVGRVGWRDGVG